MRQYIILLIPFFLTCIPGYTISEGITIQAPDFLMFYLLIYSVRYNCYIQGPTRQLYYMWKAFFCCVLISFFINILTYQYSFLSPLLKTFRLSYPLILIRYMWINAHYINDKIDNAVILSGIGCALWAIYGYFFQFPFLTAAQTTVIAGLVVNRAGSFWGDSSILGIVACYYILICISYILHKRFNSILWKSVNLLSIVLNLVAIALSSSRAGFVSLFCTLIVVGGMSKKISLSKILCLIFFFSFSIYIIYVNNISEELTSFFDTRILPLTELSSGNVNDVSSGRVELWQRSLSQYGDFNLTGLLFGQGYKMDSGIILADNGYIYVLTSTGISGFIFFLRFLFFLLGILKRRDNVHSAYYTIAVALLSCWLIASFFSDCLTYVPAILLLFFFLFLLKSNIQNYENLSD